METTNGTDSVGEQGTDIGGTGFKTPEELATGYLNLQKKLGEQGNELGTLRKDHDGLRSQAEVLAMTLKEQLGKNSQPTPKAEVPIDYGKEMATAKAELKGLDNVSEDYSSKQAELVDRIATLAAAAQHEKTLGAAGKLFKDELSNRDVKVAQQRFYDENPTFNEPEMQAKIKEYIAKDRTGMSDPLSAFYQIQRDEVAIETKRLSDENAEYKKRLNLAKGTEETGKVIVKGQSPGQSTHQPKATGKDLDAGMMAALKAQNA